MKLNEVQSLYDKRAVLYHRLFIDLLNLKGRFGRYFLESNLLHSNMRILDAGCGTGAVSRILHDVVYRLGLTKVTYNAFDFTPAMIDEFKQWMKKTGVNDIDLRYGDLLNLGQLPSSWRGYDLIVCSGVLEYIPESKLVEAMKSLASLLNEKGAIILSITRRNILTKILIGWWWRAHTFDLEEIEDVIKNADLKIVKVSGLGLMYNPFVVEIKKG